MSKYTIGIDFGTLSGRALLVDVNNGEEIAVAVFEYPHGIMNEELPCGTKLGANWALQHPKDYLNTIKKTVPNLILTSGVRPVDIIGIGIDMTACTVMPTKADGTPLCFLPEFEREPHAYVKLWKHHAAQPYADRLNSIAHERNEKWIGRYGGKISSEWLFPKIWQLLDEAPGIYQAMDRFIECGDWIVWMLTGNERRSACIAGYKAIWHKKEGYPSDEFFAALDHRLENVVQEKLARDIYPQGTCAGELTKEMAQMTGLLENTPVAVASTDAHIGMPSVKITGSGKLYAIMGTSTCCMLLDTQERFVPGICGYVEDGILPGYYGYEAGQACVGDHFAWFIQNCVPMSYLEEARKNGLDIHEYLQILAQKLRPGQSGLLALDWWNGNRSILVDSDLSGVILGMTLQTKAEEIYRALVESTAYGMRKIIDNFEQNGLSVNEIYAAGGIAEKSAFMMQLYADVINKSIQVSGSAQAPALAAAMFGACAAGKMNGGHDTIADACSVMGKLKSCVFAPNAENAKIYDLLYTEYNKLHDYFGRGENSVMKRLRGYAWVCQ